MSGWGSATDLTRDEILDIEVDRLKAKVDSSGPTFSNKGHCWVWTGRVTKRMQKYGFNPSPRGIHGTSKFFSIQAGGKIRQVHRVVYALEHGSISATDILIKECDTERCVRHWEAKSTSEAMDALRRQRYGDTYHEADEIRYLSSQGLTRLQLREIFTQWSSGSIADVLANRIYLDPSFEPVQFSMRRDYPELCRFTENEIADLRAEYAEMHNLLRLSRWANAPLTTTWEAVHGPSLIARRPLVDVAH